MRQTQDGVLAGRPVGRVGYGAMQLESGGDGVALLRRARELGVDHIDTAGFYGGGAVNALIREALHPYAEDLLLVDKVGAIHADGGLVAAQQPAQLRASVEADLRALGAERIDVVNLRRVDAPPGIVATGDQVVDLDDQLAELIALREEGKIGAIGLSAVTADQLVHAAPAGIACVQNLYNLLDRGEEPLLAECASRGIAFVPFFPLGSGFPGQPKVGEHPAVRELAARLEVTPSQIGLAWLLAHDPHILLIPGTRRVEHLEQNVAAGDIRLDARALAALDSDIVRR
ncbi:aldo/keto reductase family protein [Nocardia nova SH22a]|uniref:Aldo/keto reductase family protein n=1 Tax=Nocardia nova SH22a TaxID=1415166 RepID=W5TID6_9NOCA|nr:aldo/keto reductase [Nocardia nova]AHH16986.1 aldo/keto reductase family protein [Nocardia nova SH22a]